MREEISLKLCLLNCLVEKSGGEVEEEVLISNPNEDPDREDKQNPLSSDEFSYSNSKKLSG